MLKSAGFSEAQITGFISSFDGSIKIKVVNPGESFLRYSNESAGSGNFLTNNNYANPIDAINGLYLEASGNVAKYKQTVVVSKPTIILEGKVANSSDGAIQSVVLEKDSFVYSPGVEY